MENKEIKTIIAKEFFDTTDRRDVIRKEYDVSNWEYLDVDKMNGEEGYNRGLLRGLEEKLDVLNRIRQLLTLTKR